MNVLMTYYHGFIFTLYIGISRPRGVRSRHFLYSHRPYENDGKTGKLLGHKHNRNLVPFGSASPPANTYSMSITIPQEEYDGKMRQELEDSLK